ncbi:MAG: nickel pincer cofactor biosynthesis protein LarC, partial [Planctomycetaceae bacterium]|nr:nickel pincer cofactor biosynthesis protein LarC [Planctomycetaceae bacterium]
CHSGISGDMTLGALLDLDVPLQLLNDAVKSVLPSIEIETETVRRKGFRATLAKVIAPHEHVHRHLSDILEMIERGHHSGGLSDNAADNASNIFRLIGKAEAFVHGVDIEKIHFHEVGAADSIADITGVAFALDYLKIDKIYASPVPTGCGTVEIAHGICPVPAPATAELLKGIPIAASEIPFELTTPTGAAILKYYAKHFGTMPSMTIHKAGIGAGGRDLTEQANILRIFLGESYSEDEPLKTAAEDELAGHTHHHHHQLEHAHKHPHEHVSDKFPAVPSPTAQTISNESVWQLETNIDDLSGELIGHCIEKLWTLAPLDVWTTSVQMKKQRPGVVLSVLCRKEQIENIENVLFAETTTLGIRRNRLERSVLQREQCSVATPWGTLAAKQAVLPDGTVRVAPEFEDAKRLAAAEKISVREVYAKIQRE